MCKKVFVKARTKLHGDVNPGRIYQYKEGQKKLHSFFDSKKKIKIPKKTHRKEQKSNKTKVIKRKKLIKMYQQVRKTKLK